jgi:acetyl-CoA acetyltransferase
MDNIYIIGVGMTFFGRQKEKSIKDLTQEAVQEALQDAGISQQEIQAAYLGNCAQGLLEGQYCISGPIALRNMGFEGIPMLTVENACATASTAFYLAIQFLQSGQGDVALAVGAEKLNTGPKDKRFAIFDGCWDVYLVDESTRRLLSMAEGFEVPPGTQSADPYSIFMDIYAAGARWHMQKYGTTQRQIAAVAANNHTHSAFNPRAQYQIPMTIEQVLGSPPITYPFTMPMCSPISDGAAAAIICMKMA